MMRKGSPGKRKLKREKGKKRERRNGAKAKSVEIGS